MYIDKVPAKTDDIRPNYKPNITFYELKISKSCRKFASLVRLLALPYQNHHNYTTSPLSTLRCSVLYTPFYGVKNFKIL